MHGSSKRGPLNRRTFLRGIGAGGAAVAMGLPWLEAMGPRGTSVCNAGEIPAADRPRRSVFCSWNLGLLGRKYTPAETGIDYQITPTLKPLETLRDEFTVISGLML